MEAARARRRFFCPQTAHCSALGPCRNAQIQPERRRLLHAHAQRNRLAPGISRRHFDAHRRAADHPFHAARRVAERGQPVARGHPHAAGRDRRRRGAAALRGFLLVAPAACVQTRKARYRTPAPPRRRIRARRAPIAASPANAQALPITLEQHAARRVRARQQRLRVKQPVRRAVIARKLLPGRLERSFVFQAALIERAQSARAQRGRKRLPVGAPVGGIFSAVSSFASRGASAGRYAAGSSSPAPARAVSRKA